MKAITVNEYGGEAALTDVADPKPGAGQVLIDVKAAGINPMDTMIASGAMQEAMAGTFPLILGADLAGVVESLGAGASRFSEGDTVFGQLMVVPLGSAGTYAERVAVSEDAPLARVPDGLDPVAAASLPTAGVTALQIIDSFGRLEGKDVLIVGAAGGVGTFASQLAVNAGAQVTAAVRPDTEARMRGYGVKHTVDYTAGPVPKAVRSLHPDGIDILLDVVSDQPAFASLATLVRSSGTALTTRGAADESALSATGVLGVNFVVGVTSSDLERLAAAVADNTIEAPPIRRVTLADVPNLRNGHGGGKTVIVL